MVDSVDSSPRFDSRIREIKSSFFPVTGREWVERISYRKSVSKVRVSERQKRREGE